LRAGSALQIELQEKEAIANDSTHLLDLEEEDIANERKHLLSLFSSDMFGNSFVVVWNDDTRVNQKKLMKVTRLYNINIF
jgi:hypothetical protein